MRPRKDGQAASETKDHWCTSRAVLDVVDEFNGRPPALDPCSNPSSLVGASINWFDPAGPYGDRPNACDGLTASWKEAAAGGLAFCNPPFTQKRPWAAKCSAEAARGAEIVALLPADTDTVWFQVYGVTAEALCFWRGRVIFVGDRQYPARFPVVLLYWGPRAPRFREVFGRKGWVP